MTRWWNGREYSQAYAEPSRLTIMRFDRQNRTTLTAERRMIYENSGSPVVYWPHPCGCAGMGFIDLRRR